MIIFNDEYKKLLEEKKQLENEEEVNKNSELFFIRLCLKKVILKLIGTRSIDINNIFKELNYFSKSEEIKLIKEYRDYFKNNTDFFPSFIFDDYSELNFKKCIEYKNLGYALNEIEKFYINEVKNKYQKNHI